MGNPEVVTVVAVVHRGDRRPPVAMDRLVVWAAPGAAFFDLIFVFLRIVVPIAAVVRLSCTCGFARVDCRTVCVEALWLC